MTAVTVRWAAPSAPATTERLLTAEERDRLDRFARSDDRDRFRSAHVLARTVVAERLGIEVSDVSLGAECTTCGGPHGQPVIAEPAAPGLHLSLAHAGQLVVVALAGQPVGVDVEPSGAASLDVASLALSPREHQHLLQLPEARQADVLTRWWVRKEAVVKAAGLGLTVDLGTVEVTPPPGAPRPVRWAGHPGRYRLAEVDVGAGHTAAVATAGRRRPSIDGRLVDLSSMG
ncbi:MAG: 4'-phosphopantetheinyl transferase family protein [Acidimicrobiales bacterium]